MPNVRNAIATAVSIEPNTQIRDATPGYSFRIGIVSRTEDAVEFLESVVSDEFENCISDEFENCIRKEVSPART